MNFGALKAAVIAWANRSDIASMLPIFLGLAEQRIYTGMPEQGVDGMRVQRMLTRVYPFAGVLPDDCLQVQRLAVVSGGWSTALEWRPLNEMTARTSGNGTAYYSLQGADVVYGNSLPAGASVDLLYYARFASPAVDSDENWLMANGGSLYLYAMLAEVATYTRDGDLLTSSLELYASAQKALMKRDADTLRGDGPLRIISDTMRSLSSGVASAIVGGADTAAPVLTGAIMASSITTDSYSLSWPAGTDDAGITSYELSVDGGATYTSVGAATVASVTGRTAGATDEVRVRALDAAGNVSNVLSTSVTLSAAAGQSGLQALGSADTERVSVVGFSDSNGGFTSTGFDWHFSGTLINRFGCFATGLVCPIGTGAVGASTDAYRTRHLPDTTYSSDESSINSQGNSPGYAAFGALWFVGPQTAQGAGYFGGPKGRWGAASMSANVGGVTIYENHPIWAASQTVPVVFSVLYARAPSGPLSGGSLTPTVRYSRGSTSTFSTGAAISTTGGAAPEIARYTHTLAAGARTAGADISFRVHGGGAVVAPFGYCGARAEVPSKLNGICYHPFFSTSSACAYDMAQALQNAPMAALTTYFAEVRRPHIDVSQTPKVVVYINTGFNDSSAVKSPSPSLGPSGGSTAAGSAAAFIDNLTALKLRIEQVWTTNGWPVTELHWLFVPSHAGANRGTEIPAYDVQRKALVSSALGTAARTSVVDLITVQPPGSVGATTSTWQDAAAALGWYSGQTGPGTATIDAMMPHLRESSGSTPNEASIGYAGVSEMIVGLIP